MGAHIPAAIGLKMIFDHDEEEERELQAFDGINPTPTTKPNMNLVE